MSNQPKPNLHKAHDSPLGKANTYVTQYTPELLFPIARNQSRAVLGIDSNQLPFQGKDFWTAYEVSWLNEKGKPMVAVAGFTFPCTSPNLIESKSFKLYLNSLNGTKFPTINAVKTTLANDLSAASGAKVDVKLTLASALGPHLAQFHGVLIDTLDIPCEKYAIDASLLSTENKVVTETLYSELLKSNCPVTGQPDWASLQIHYTGKRINHASLLQYIVSYRDHNGFHEDCVERIFTDISKHCQPEKLFVYARYTRRGGLDINPYRANFDIDVDNARLYRQ